MDIEKLSYPLLLKYIDDLRQQGLTDNHPRMVKAKTRLRDLLELRKTKPLKKAALPKLTSISTVQIEAPVFGENKETNKYLLLGAMVAIFGVMLKFWKTR